MKNDLLLNMQGFVMIVKRILFCYLNMLNELNMQCLGACGMGLGTGVVWVDMGVGIGWRQGGVM